MTQFRGTGFRSMQTHTPAMGPFRFVAATVLCAVCLFPTPSQAQTYDDLWKKGEYKEALTVLQAEMENAAGWSRRSMQRDLAELLFTVGQVDEAIATVELLAADSSELRDAARLAELYQYKGDLAAFATALEQAYEVAQRLMRYGMNQEDFLATGKLAELRGDDPKNILGTHYKVLIDQRPMFTEAYVAAGDLALQHGGYQLAAGHYTGALDLEPDNQRALAGLLECNWRVGENPQRIDELRERLLALNPHHFRPKALEAERMLDVGQSDLALALINEVLSVNPNEIHFRSMKAAAFYLQDKTDAMLDVQQSVLAFNPIASEVFREPGRVAARHYRFRDAASFQRKALETDPGDNDARAELAFNLLRLGDTDEGQVLLEQAFAADPFNVQAFNMLNVLDTLSEFTVVERGPFVVRLPEYEARLLADDMIALMEEELALYEAKYEVTLNRPIYLEVFEDHDEFMVRSVGLPGNAGHLGICFGELITMDSPRARPPGSSNWHSVLWHEFVHVVTLQKTKNRMPRWLSEGISVYEETARNAAWGTAMDIQYKPMYRETPAPSLADLETYFAAPRSAQHLMYGYFVAGEFITHYVSAYGQAALVDALDRIAEGEKAGPALAAAAEVDDDAITDGFAAYLAVRCAPFDVFAEPPAPEAEGDRVAQAIGPPMHSGPWTSQPSPYIDSLKKAMEAWENEDFEAAAEGLRRTHEMFPEAKTGNAPLRLLARLYKQTEDTERYIAVLEEIVGWDATAFNDAMTLADHYSGAGQWDDVVRVTSIAQGISPFDAALLKKQADAFEALDEPLKAADRYARLALIDGPREGDYRMARARALQSAGEDALARRETVSLLEKMPRFWEAQQLLLELQPKASETEPETAPESEAEPSAEIDVVVEAPDATN